MPRDNNLIPLQNFNKSGLSSSKWSGFKDSFYRLIGHDPHTLPGALGVEQALTKISETTVDEFCKVGVNLSNGSVIGFSSDSGKIWEIQSDGTVRLVYTVTPILGEAKCLGAVEYQGKLIWATEKRLHYITIADAITNNWVANAVEDWQTFDIGDAEFHPMLNHTATLILYIGDGNQVAQYDGVLDVFSSNALDIRTPLRVKSLGEIGTDVLVGTFISSTVSGVELIRWNTWDDSFANVDKIPEIGINAFFPSDNIVLVQAGNKGNIYWYDGVQLKFFMKIPGEFTSSDYGEVHPYSVAVKDGQIIFGFSALSGNPCPQLIYRIARHSSDYDLIMDQPYPISERSGSEFVTTGLEIGFVIAQGDVVICSWKNGSTYGFDKMDVNTKLNGAYWETPVKSGDREKLSNFAEAFITYANLPTGTNVDFYLDKNYAGYGDALAKQTDTDRNVISTKDEGQEFVTLQLKVVTTTVSNTAPLIESGAIRLR